MRGENLMALRALLIDDKARAKVAQVVRYAESHPYEPTMDAPEDSPDVPGDNPHCICYLNSYRCVFSYTKVHGETFRDLSISVPGDKWPNPFAVWTIAELFGFSGWDQQSEQPPQDWMVAKDRILAAVRVAQKI